MCMVLAGGAARRRRSATGVGSAAPSYGRGLRWPSCHKRTLPGRTNAARLQARRRADEGGGSLLSGYNALPAAGAGLCMFGRASRGPLPGPGRWPRCMLVNKYRC